MAKKDELEKELQETIEKAEEQKDDPEAQKQEDEIEEEKTKEEEAEEREKKEEPDYEKKFKASTQEAQVLHAGKRKLEDSINQAITLKDVTQEEILEEYPEFEDLNSFEQKLARDSVLNKKRIEALNEVTKDSKDAQAWSKKVDEFADDPKALTDNPRLEGRLDEFKVFANKPTRRNADIDDLISAFLFNVDETKPPQQKGKMFETGTGGDKTSKPKSDKLTVGEAAQLMNTDYDAYKKALRENRVDFDSVSE